MSINQQPILEALKNRRSIYPNMYASRPIEQEVIESILESANWAPTHKLTEPWRFMVFHGQGLQRLAQFQANLYKQVQTEAGNYKEEQYQKLLNKPLLASHIIAIGMKRDEKARVPEIEEISAVACAVQNMYLAANAQGVGCYWGTGGVTYYPEAKSFFGLAPEDKLMGFMYMGYLKNDHWPEGKRQPIAPKVTWVNE